MDQRPNIVGTLKWNPTRKKSKLSVVDAKGKKVDILKVIPSQYWTGKTVYTFDNGVGFIITIC